MGEKWLERVRSSIPRGFSRCYIVRILRESPHTGKEIIDRAARESGGGWKPSPGLIYPLLGRLLDEGLIEEVEESGGRYALTKRGTETAEDVRKVEESVRRQIDMLFRLGNVGRFAAADVIERITSIGSMLDPGRITREEAWRYRQFLKGELERLDAVEVATEAAVAGGGSGAEPDRHDAESIRVE